MTDSVKKTVLFLGSSVTRGSAAGGRSFVEVLAEKYGFDYVKEAVDGTTLADIGNGSYVTRLKKTDTDRRVDLFVCQLSTNDAYRGIPLCKTEQAVVYITEYVKKTYGCPVIFFTGTRFYSAEYERAVEMMVRLKDELGFELIDLWNNPRMNAVDPERYKIYMNDPVHPTVRGYREWWVPEFEKVFDRYFTKKIKEETNDETSDFNCQRRE